MTEESMAWLGAALLAVEAGHSTADAVRFADALMGKLRENDGE